MGFAIPKVKLCRQEWENREGVLTDLAGDAFSASSRLFGRELPKGIAVDDRHAPVHGLDGGFSPRRGDAPGNVTVPNGVFAASMRSHSA